MDDDRMPDVAPVVHAGAAADEANSARERRIGLASLVSIVTVAVVGLIVLPSIWSGQDVEAPIADVGPSASVIPAEAPVTPIGDAGLTSGDPDETDAPLVSEVSQGKADRRSERIAQIFQTELDTDATMYGIAYVDGDSFVVLDARGVTQPNLEIAQEFAHVSELALLTTDGATWAVSASDRDSSYLVSNTYVVVEAERPDTIAVVDLEQNSIGIMSSGLPIPGVELPAGAEIIVVQQRGVLVLPRTGGTFELSGTASSLTRLSQARALSASVGATVYERCDDELRCSYFAVKMGSDSEWPLAVADRPTLDISPSGAWVMARTTEGNQLIEVESGEIVELESGSIDAVAWAPDDRFVAVGRGDTVELIIPGERRSFEMPLSDPLQNDTLLVFSS